MSAERASYRDLLGPAALAASAIPLAPLVVLGTPGNSAWQYAFSDGSLERVLAVGGGLALAAFHLLRRGERLSRRLWGSLTGTVAAAASSLLVSFVMVISFLSPRGTMPVSAAGFAAWVGLVLLWVGAGLAFPAGYLLGTRLARWAPWGQR